MVAPAQGRQTIEMGLTRRTSVIHRDVLLDVVEVAYLRRTTTPGIDTGGVSEPDCRGHPRRRVVPIDPSDGGVVYDRSDGDLSRGQEPGLEPAHQNRA